MLSVDYLRDRLLDALQARYEAALRCNSSGLSVSESDSSDSRWPMYWDWQEKHQKVHQTLLLLAAARTDNYAYRDLVLSCLSNEDPTTNVEYLQSFLDDLCQSDRPSTRATLELEARTLIYFLSLTSDASREDVDPEYQWFLEPEHPVEDPAEDGPSPETVVRTRYDRLREPCG